MEINPSHGVRTFPVAKTNAPSVDVPYKARLKHGHHAPSSRDAAPLPQPKSRPGYFEKGSIVDVFA